MKIFICADMEGISGIGNLQSVKVDHPEYQNGRKRLTEDVNACAEGCFEAGAKAVTVMDAHHAGSNLLIDLVHPKVNIAQGKGTKGRMHDIGKYDALILIGYHAMAGTAEAFIDHTMSPDSWQNCWLNGVKVGEFGIDAAIAADEGVPTIMVSGDDKIAKEATRAVKGIFTAIVKYSSGKFCTELLPLKTAHDIIRKNAFEACRSIKKIKPYPVKKSVCMRLEVTQNTEIPCIPAKFPDRKIIDSRTFEVTAKTTREALYRLIA
ncbi:MAG: M55 family metallopeptidase [Fibrobacteres bacterium]|nr:M55 family metallopeptidase [Fibrobacterota bacterium]